MPIDAFSSDSVPVHLMTKEALQLYMSHLRQKLEADPAQPIHLLTETGIGYRFEP